MVRRRERERGIKGEREKFRQNLRLRQKQNKYTTLKQNNA